MARVSAIGSKYVVLVLTADEARGLNGYLPDRVAAIPGLPSAAAAVNRAIRALRRGVDLLSS